MMLYNCIGYISAGTLSIPEIFGAVGDGVTDDSDAIQRVLDEGGFVCLSSGKVYRTTKTIKIKKDTILDLNGSTIKSDDAHVFFNFLASDANSITGYNGNGNIVICNGKITGGCLSFAHGQNILIKDIVFSECINDHFMEIAGCKNFVVANCRFEGMSSGGTSTKEYINIDECNYTAFPWVFPNTAFYDGTKNSGLTIEDCSLSVGTGNYEYGETAIGVHYVSSSDMHNDIIIKNNRINGFTLCGLRINNINGALLFGNTINVNGNGIRVGDVSYSEKVVIKNNVIISTGTAITKANNSTVFQSADNDINPTFS